MPVGVVIGVSSAVLTALVAEIYCHRCLAHRALRVHPVVASALELFFRVTGGTDAHTWAAIHRLHHRYADTPLDPHSPLQQRPLAVLLGTPVLYSRARRRLAPDAVPPTDRAHVVLRALLIGGFLAAFGPGQVLVMVGVHLACYLGTMGAINTAGHRIGRKPHPGVPGYDSALLAIALLGHGYHNSHHAHPAAARTGRFDPIWPVLRLLATVGAVDLDGRRSPDGAPPRLCCAASMSVARSL
ncbi:MAG TPA: fatty acid desaturase [Acidimicrobiales bacterium]|nr:fatty acid desaturase [Acidimicrobiales bacterium]